MRARRIIGLLLVLWNLPWMLHLLGVDSTRPLKGHQSNPSFPQWNWSEFQNGHIQSQLQDGLRTGFPFRADAVRLQHQKDWSLFGKQHVRNTVVGQDRYLFEHAYVEAARGIDPLNPAEIERRARQLRNVVDSSGTPLLVVLAPGKGHFYRDFLPPCEGAACGEEPNRGHRLWKQALEAEGIPVLDLHAAFDSLRQRSPHPLFPRTGIHWSQYSMVHVMPALTEGVNALVPDSLASGQWAVQSLRTSSTPEGTDDDIEQAMNLLFDLPDFEMAYPSARWIRGASPPKVLLVGDSYAWTPVNAGLLRSGWQGEFWFYNQTVHGPSVPRKGMPVSERIPNGALKFFGELDALVLLSTDANLSRFPFGFAGIGNRQPMDASPN